MPLDSSCCAPSAAAFCLHPFPQSLPVETLGPESTVDAELESAPQALGSPSKTAVGELAGAEDGGGNRAPGGWGPISSGKGGLVRRISWVGRGLNPSCRVLSWCFPAGPAW